MKKRNTTTLLSLAVISTVVLQFCKGADLYQSPTGSCLAPNSWFPHAQTPPPLEGAGSAFANPDSTTNCDFHLWSWQKFLYLTQTDVNGKARFENLVQVNNQMQSLGDTLTLIDSSQAGTHSILTDKKNRALYYSIYMDTMMYRFSKQYVTLFKNNCVVNDTIQNSLVQKFGYDTLTYPVGSFEIKAAWMFASSLLPAELPFFYTTTARLNNQNVKVALVGMHIVGRVINHPEFIWATYQHMNAAPIAKWPGGVLSNTSTPNPQQILSSIDQLFYKANTPLDCCNISINKPANVKQPFKSIYHLFDHGTQVYYPGILPNLLNNDTTNLQNIKSINQSVFAKLNVEGAPWSFYEYYGSLWIDPTTATLQPGDGGIGGLTRANLRGSRALSNIAAETYIQSVSSAAPTPTTSFNCFGCHNTSGNNSAGYNLALSHLFNNNLGEQTQGDKEQKSINLKVNQK